MGWKLDKARGGSGRWVGSLMRPAAAQVYPSSYMAAKCLEKPKLLSSPTLGLPDSGMDASFGFTEPCRRARSARMCFAGDGGGNGRLNPPRAGVDATLEFAGGPL
ncbi:hypothetical protein E2562_000009 [Oryza meyeriana var. granulata]|uniref:Uncharacterized protein n=1 Tax=Oryza meyeriana var. granulata TaxID=110450 RepID=A0A6G1DD47_9ORYZ|nr:hypothetical protein E2562_000009 [Oryza meyeriana var. granulata]